MQHFVACHTSSFSKRIVYGGKSYMNLGERLKQQRKKYYFTQQDVADKLHVTRQTISSWETGRTIPDIEMLILLSELYDLSLDQMIKGDIIVMDNVMNKNRKQRRKIVFLTSVLIVVFLCLTAYMFLHFEHKQTSISIDNVESVTLQDKSNTTVLVITYKDSIKAFGYLLNESSNAVTLELHQSHGLFHRKRKSQEIRLENAEVVYLKDGKNTMKVN